MEHARLRAIGSTGSREKSRRFDFAVSHDAVFDDRVQQADIGRGGSLGNAEFRGTGRCRRCVGSDSPCLVFRLTIVAGAAGSGQGGAGFGRSIDQSRAVR